MIGFLKKLFGVAPAIEVAPYKVEVQPVTPVVQAVVEPVVQAVVETKVQAVAPVKKPRAKKPAGRKKTPAAKTATKVK